MLLQNQANTTNAVIKFALYRDLGGELLSGSNESKGSVSSETDLTAKH